MDELTKDVLRMGELLICCEHLEHWIKNQRWNGINKGPSWEYKQGEGSREAVSKMLIPYPIASTCSILAELCPLFAVIGGLAAHCSFSEKHPAHRHGEAFGAWGRTIPFCGELATWSLYNFMGKGQTRRVRVEGKITSWNIRSENGGAGSVSVIAPRKHTRNLYSISHSPRFQGPYGIILTAQRVFRYSPKENGNPKKCGKKVASQPDTVLRYWSTWECSKGGPHFGKNGLYWAVGQLWK